MPEVTMTIEEYLALVEATGVKLQAKPATRRQVKQAKRARRTGKKDPKMAKALRKANALGRTKTGKLRKGMTQAKIMKKAHQLRRKMR